MTEPRLALNFAACSDRGLVRSNNEDSAYAGPHLLALADGMGGHAAGEIASAFVIEALQPLDTALQQQRHTTEKLSILLAAALENGNQRIATHVDENPQLEGMGCTTTSLLFRGNSAGICHVGDSRAYLLRGEELIQLTRDDTFVQSLVDEGRLDPADVSSHPQRSLILKALNGRPVEPALHSIDTAVGDRYMLCSDGLSDPVSFDTIREVLITADSPRRAAHKLVEMALRGGGPDNVTVVVADLVEAGDATPEPVLAGAVAPEDAPTISYDSPAARAAAGHYRITNESRPGGDTGAAAEAGDAGEAGAAHHDREAAAQPDRSGEGINATETAGIGGQPAAGQPGRAQPEVILPGSGGSGVSGNGGGPGGSSGRGGRGGSGTQSGHSTQENATTGPHSSGAAAGLHATGTAGNGTPGVGKESDNTADNARGKGRATQGATDPHTHPEQRKQRKWRGRQSRRSRTSWIIGLLTLVVLAAAIIGGSALWHKKQDTYFLATVTSPDAPPGAPQNIVVYRGLPNKFLGITLHSKYQEICLDAEGQVTLLDETGNAGSNAPNAGAADNPGGADDCHRFMTSDLSPSARATLENMPADNYEAVVAQVQRLAEHALPACVTRTPERSSGTNHGKSHNNGHTKDDSKSHSGRDTAKEEAERDRAKRNQPGHTHPKKPDSSTRPGAEDLTTPGVSCREVN